MRKLFLLFILGVIGSTMFGSAQTAAGFGSSENSLPTTLLLAGLSTNFSILSVLGIIGSVTFAALYFSTKRRRENS